MPIQIPLPDLTGYPKTQLSISVDPGDNVLPVFDASSFSSTQFVVVGVLGQNGTEAPQIIGPNTNQTFTINNINYPHVRGEEVRFVPFNQWQIFRSTDGGNTYSSIDTTNVNWNQLYTNYFDQTGSTQYLYYAQQYNSYTSVLGPKSSIVPGTGYPNASLFNLRQRARINLRDKSANVQWKDDEIDQWISDSYVELQRVLSNINKNWYMKDSGVLLFTANQQEYAMPIDCKIPSYIWASQNTSGTNLYTVTPVRMQRVFDQQYATPAIFNTINYGYNSTCYFNGTNIGFWPIPQYGSYKLRYVPTSIPLVYDTDTMILPLSEYVDIMDNGVLSKAYKKKDITKSEYYQKLWDTDKILMAGELSKRQTASDSMVGTTDNLFLDPFISDSYGPDYYGDFN